MTRTPFRVSVAGIALALAAGVGATSAYAQDAPPPPPPAAGAPAQPHGPWHHGDMGHKHMMWRDSLMIPGLGPINRHQVQALKLDADQQAKLKQAQDAQRSMFEARRDAMTKQRVLVDQELSSGKLDPRALVSAWEANRQPLQTQEGQVRDKWLAVWDSLSDAQRTQVAGFVKAREAKVQAMRDRHHEHMHHAPKPAGAAPAGTAPSGASTD